MKKHVWALGIMALLAAGANLRCKGELSGSHRDLAGSDGGADALAAEIPTKMPVSHPSECSGCLEQQVGQGGQPFDPAARESEFVTLDADGALEIDPRHSRLGRFLWVADTNLPGVAKIDLDQLKLVSRYITGGSSTSRTTVNVLGEAFIGARADGNGRAGVTKILPDVQGCIDRNGDGLIRTSGNEDEVLPWGQDDCVAWHTETDGDIRGLAAQDISGPMRDRICEIVDGNAKEFDPQTAAPADQHYIWAGGTHGKVYKIDADTGQILLTTTAPVPVYGMALSGDGKLWVGAGGGGFGFIDTTRCTDQISCEAAPICSQPCTATDCPATCDGAVKASFTGMLGGYGITVDAKRRVWRSGYPQEATMRYDPQAPPHQRLALAKVGAFGGGIAVDAAGWVWAAHLNGKHVVRIDAETLEGTTIPAPSKGVAIDPKGRVFAVQYEGAVHLIEPGKGLEESKLTLNAVPLKGIAYAYSDMTGVQTRLASGEPGWYRETFSPCADGALEWQQLKWETEVPPDTWAMFNVRSADDPEALKNMSWVTVACIASPGGQGQAGISGFRGKLLEVEVRFVAKGDLNRPETVASARIKSFSALHRCTKVE